MVAIPFGITAAVLVMCKAVEEVGKYFVHALIGLETLILKQIVCICIIATLYFPQGLYSVINVYDRWAIQFYQILHCTCIMLLFM